MKLTALCPCPKSGDFRSLRQKHGNAAGDHGHPATETTLGVLPTYGKAQAAPEAGESVDGLQGGIQVCGSHTCLELLSSLTSLRHISAATRGKELLLSLLSR